jgi:uncharacterized phage protein (TIGR01671 family)
MEDRYLFKAKRIDNGEWEIGSLIALPTGEYEISNKCNNPPDCDPMWDKVVITHKVDPSTICQCTGLKDKNGKWIWENDVVRDGHGNLYKAFWQNNYYQFSWICVKSDVLIGSKLDLWDFKSFEIEVIGNIFDNPELLESEG